MLRMSQLFRKSLCFLLVLTLLLSAGCGTETEGTASSMAEDDITADSTDTSTQQTAPTQETEPVKDKFAMLKEVYELLSGPLGEPYRTPEYWGGEEIDLCLLHPTQIIEVILHKVVGIGAVACFHPMHTAVLLNGSRKDHQPSLLLGLADERLHRRFVRLDAAAWKFIVVVFEAVHHRHPAVLDGDAAGRMANKSPSVLIVVAGVHGKE